MARSGESGGGSRVEKGGKGTNNLLWPPVSKPEELLLRDCCGVLNKLQTLKKYALLRVIETGKVDKLEDGALTTNVKREEGGEDGLGEEVVEVGEDNLEHPKHCPSVRHDRLPVRKLDALRLPMNVMAEVGKLDFEDEFGRAAIHSCNGEGTLEKMEGTVGGGGVGDSILGG